MTKRAQDQALTQAGRYGEQVRLLEDQGLEADRANIRKAWTCFRRQFIGGWQIDNPFYKAIVDAYYVEYCK